MDQITQEDVSPKAEGKLTSPLSPKRPRTESPMVSDHVGKSKFNITELFQKFRKSIGSPPSTSTLQENADPVHTEQCGDIDDEKAHEHLQDTKFIVTPITSLSDSNTDNAHRGSSNACFITSERRFPLVMVKDVRPPVTETYKLSSYLQDNAGQALAESHTSKDTSVHMSVPPDSTRLGKSLEDEPHGGCNLPTEDDKNESQVQNGVGPIQVFTLSSCDEEVTCQSDSAYEDMLHDTRFGDTQSRFDEGSTQKKNGHTENTLLSKEKEEVNSEISASDYADSKLFYSNPEEEPSGNVAEGVKNEEEISAFQIREYEMVAVGEIKGQVNENDVSNNAFSSAAECAAEGSIVSSDVLLARHTALENVGLAADDLCGPKGEHAAGKMIAEAPSEMSDHTTETPMPARIRQEPAVGDNDTIPAIWSETHKEGGEKRHNSESSAGVELTPLHVRPSHEVPAPNLTGQFNHQSRPQQCKNEKNHFSQSNTEPQACSTATNEGYCHWKSSPGSEIQKIQDTLGHQLKDHGQSGCFPDNSDHLMSQEVVEYLLSEIARLDGENEMQEREEMTSIVGEVITDEHWKSENPLNLEGKNQQNEKHKGDTTEMSTGDFIHCCTKGKMNENGNTLTHIDEEMGQNRECLTDQLCSVVIPTEEGTTEEKEIKEEARVREETDEHSNSETLVHQQHSQQKDNKAEASPDKCVSAWKEGITSGNNSAPVSHNEQANKLMCSSVSQHSAETFMLENKDDLLAFTFPPTSDAVVPGPQELIHSQNADNNNNNNKPPALKCSDRFSPVPSAFTFCNRVPGGFDTFEKIQFSLEEDGDEEASLSSSPLLNSLPPEKLRTTQRQKYQDVPEEEKEEEEVERSPSHSGNMANISISSDFSCNEVPNFLSAADVGALTWPDSKSNSLDCDLSNGTKFEMKKQFDKVLRELSLYFDFSRNDFEDNSSRASSPEPSGDATEALEVVASICTEHLSSPELGRHKDTLSDEDRSLDMCGGEPVVSCTSGRGDSEQEVPLSSHLDQEESMYTAEELRELRELEQKKKMWSPSFMCQPFLGLCQRPAEPTRRLEPLRTCKRPLRVGLSKRAKFKQLHRPHPYK